MLKGWFRSVHCRILETGNDSYRFKDSSEAAQKETKGDDNIDHNMTADKQ